MGQSDGSVRVAFKAHLGSGRAGHKRIRKGRSPKEPREGAPSIPRVARLLALAHHFDELLRAGVVRDYAEIARLFNVSRAHVTQVMNLLFLAPDIQEEILFSIAEPRGGAVPSPRCIRRVAAEPEWKKQRGLWRSLIHGRMAVTLPPIPSGSGIPPRLAVGTEQNRSRSGHSSQPVPTYQPHSSRNCLVNMPATVPKARL